MSKHRAIIYESYNYRNGGLEGYHVGYIDRRYKRGQQNRSAGYYDIATYGLNGALELAERHMERINLNGGLD